MWDSERISEAERLRRFTDPTFSDTTTIPAPDTSECTTSVYTPGEGETPVE